MSDDQSDDTKVRRISEIPRTNPKQPKVPMVRPEDPADHFGISEVPRAGHHQDHVQEREP